MSLAVADWSGPAWLQGFNDVGLVVFGMPANELVEIKVCASHYHTRVNAEGLQENDDAKYNVILHKATCTTYNFSCRAKLDEYNVRLTHHPYSLCSHLLCTLGTIAYTLWYLENQSFELQRGGDGLTGFAAFGMGTAKLNGICCIRLGHSEVKIVHILSICFLCTVVSSLLLACIELC